MERSPGVTHDRAYDSYPYARPAGEGWALIPTGALAIALLLKSRLEERWLLDRHPAHAGYRRHVRRRFIPYLW